MSKKHIIITIICTIIVILLPIVLGYQHKNKLYQNLIKSIENKEWIKAHNIYSQLGEYKDSKQYKANIDFNYYIELAENNVKNKNFKYALNFYNKALLIDKNNAKLIEKIDFTEKENIKLNIINQKKEIEENEKLAREKVKSKIDPSAIYKIPTSYGKGYDRTITKYGINGIKKINNLMPKVAELVARNNRCSKVLDVDVSDERSSKNSLVFYAECGDMNDFMNIERFYVSENDLKNNVQTQSVKQEMEKKQGQYINLCELEIKSRLYHPSTYKSNTLIDKAIETQSFTTVVRIDFKAKNSFNLETNNTGVCRFNSKNELIDIIINESN